MKRFLPLLATAFSFIFASSGRADTMSNSASFSFTNPNNATLNSSTWNSVTSSLIIPVSHTFTSNSAWEELLAFDSNEGTLNSVTFNIAFTSSEVNGQVVGNGLNIVSLMTITPTISLGFQNITAFNGAPSLSETEVALNLALFNGSFSDSGPGSFQTATFSNASQLSAVTASNSNTTFNINLESSDLYAMSAVVLGTVTLSAYSKYIGTVTVTYDYTPIPENSTLFLFFSGVLVLCFCVYKRGRRQRSYGF